MTRVAICLCVLSLTMVTVADTEKTVREEAITFSGMRVILYTDGTWAAKAVAEPNTILFRGVPWGASRARIKEAEAREPMYENEKGMGFHDSIGGLEVGCIYLFASDTFVRGRYSFLTQHSNANWYCTEFEVIEAKLREKYGEPVESKRIWQSTSYREDPERWGTGIAMGVGTWYSEWTVGPVTIGHMLQGDNGKIDHRVEYSHQELSKIENALQAEKDRSRL